MTNLAMEVDGNILTIKIDLQQNQGVSKSGKSTIVATTSGNVDVPGQSGMKIGINAYKPISQN